MIKPHKHIRECLNRSKVKGKRRVKKKISLIKICAFLMREPTIIRKIKKIRGAQR